MPPPLRILMVVNLPWDVRLGAARVWFELGEEWRAAGHSVERFTLSEAFPAGSKSPAQFALQQIFFPLKTAAFIRKNAARYDVIDALIGTVPSSKRRLGFNGSLVARSVGLYLLYTRFEQEAQQRWPRAKGRIAGRLFYDLIRRRGWRNAERSVRAADLVNVPNPAEAECLRAEFGANLQIVVHPYGLNADRARALSDSAAAAPCRRAEQRICFVGMWGPRKGSHDWRTIVLRIRNEFPAVSFKFLGTMVDAGQIRGELGAGAAENCEFVWQYEPDELPALLSDCTAGAFPSYVEGFGLAVIEQLAARLPTIAYDTPGPREILQSLPELLVPCGDVERFAAAICSVLRLEVEEYARLAQRSAAAAAAYAWSEIADETISDYRQIRGPTLMTSRPLVTITTRLPPATCGIGTHSFLLREHWPASAASGVFLVIEDAERRSTLAGGDQVISFRGKGAQLARELERIGSADVLLHYTARAYQRHGCPFWLPRVITDWKRRFPEGRLMIFVHEVAGSFPITSRHHWLGRVDAWILRRFARIAEVLVTNTEGHARKLRALSGRSDVHLMPVGSNIPAAASPPPPRQRTEFALFGLPFGRLQTLRMFTRYLRDWQSSGRLTRLHIIGPRGDERAREAERLLSELSLSDLAVHHGMLAPAEVAALLQRAQCALTNVTADNWSKSGAFMAAAANRCAVVYHDEIHAPGASALVYAVRADELETISDADIARRTEALAHWYEENADWRVTAARLAELWDRSPSTT